MKLVIALAFTFALAASAASAHDATRMQADFSGYPGDPKEIGNWLHGLSSKKSGGSCCNGFDGKPPQAWVRTSGTGIYGEGSHYEVMIEHNWVTVPDDAVITEPNKFGAAVVWYSTSHNGEHTNFNIKCFLPGELY
jgi:hypothetical protein